MRATFAWLGVIAGIALFVAIPTAQAAPTPQVSFVSPTSADSYQTTTPVMDLVVQVSGPKLLAVTWSNDRGGTGTLADTAKQHFQATGVPLQLGDNRIRVEAINAWGASSVGTLSVSLLSAPSEAENHPPTVDGSPAPAADVGYVYDFRPIASDPDGDPLTFSIRNKPAWTSFEMLTGRLRGTPTDADVASYSGIEITASDGAASASLAPFSVVVNDPAAENLSVTLSWTPPIERADGTALTDLAGYRIYYGADSAQLDQVIAVDGAGLSSYVISGLPAGTWYFAMTALDAGGLESGLSAIASGSGS
jgi:hypothetical protein